VKCRRVVRVLSPEILDCRLRYIEHVLRNLIGNARKYGPGSPVQVALQVSEDGEALVSVRDRGPGIQPDESEQIFDRFYRAPSTSMRASGAGMGLTVCRTLVTAMGGTIWAKPREGGGLEVAFTLPLYESEAL
jgi:signal transduction histidine kinase